MKSFIAALTQADRYTAPVKTVSPNAVNTIEAGTAVRDAAVEDKYLTLFDDGDLTTVEIAAALNMKTNTVLRPLNRLVARGLLWRVDVEKSAGSMPTIVWSTTNKGKCARNANARFCKVLESGSRGTQQIADACNISYYGALARLKRMEANGLVTHIGTHRKIIWSLKANNVE